MFVFTRDITAKNFTALRGMRVTGKYASHYARQRLQAVYGDCIKEIDRKNLSEFSALFSDEQSKALMAEQAHKIEKLEKENADLRSRLSAKKQN